METSKLLQKSEHLLDDLESIRKLLGDDTLQPPLLTDTVHQAPQVPLLFDVIDEKPFVDVAHEAYTPPPAAPRSTLAPPAIPSAPKTSYVESELRKAAQQIMQDVIDDFAPHIENEIKRRLDARMEWLLSHYPA